MIQTLSKNNVPPTQIAQLSGHKSLKSIENYSHLNRAQNNRCIIMSNVLANISSECTPTVTPSTSAVFRPEGACRFSNPGQQSMVLFSGAVIHGGQSSFCDHQHCESIATASSSFGKAKIEKNRMMTKTL